MILHFIIYKEFDDILSIKCKNIVYEDDNRFNIIGIKKKDLFEFMSDIQKRCDDEYIKAKFLLKTEE